jgi:hypothetical protein
VTAPKTAKTMEAGWSESTVPSCTEFRVEDTPEFRFIRTSQCPALVLQEMCDFLDAQDTSHPFQFPKWSEGESQLAWLRHQGRVRWFAHCGILYPASRILRSVRALTVTRGPVCDDLEVMELGLRHLAEAGRGMGVAYIDIAPEWCERYAERAKPILSRNGWQALPATRTSLRLELSPDLDDLLAGFRKTTRYEIRRSERQPATVTIADKESDWHDFFRLYREMAIQKHFRAESADFLLKVFRWLAADRNRGGLFLAREDGTLRGGVVIVRSGVRCWYVFGATSKDSKLGAGYLLQWRVIQWAKEKGCLEYDFGGFREGACSGPALFKRGFGGRVVKFLPPHRYVVSPGRLWTSDFINGVRHRLRG